MILLLSPAKTLDFNQQTYPRFTQPRFQPEQQTLIDRLREFDRTGLKKLMNISDKLAALNEERYAAYAQPFHPENAKPALLAFRGDVYTGLNVDDFSRDDLLFAQQHVRILSGLYGLLRPLDLMQAYRLEMGTKLATERGANLYEFWGTQLTDALRADLHQHDHPVVVNLASKEYFGSLQPEALNADLYDIDFREQRGGKWKFITYNAKKARGRMTSYVVKNRLNSPEQLRDFDWDDYGFNEELSSERKLVFTR